MKFLYLYIPSPSINFGQSAENMAENPVLESKESELKIICISPESADKVRSGISEPVNPMSE